MNGNEGTSTRPFGWAAVIFLAVLVLLGRVPDLFYDYRNPDEAVVMAESWAMTKGQVLYTDVPQIHPFLNFALVVPFFEVLRPERVPLAITTMNLLLIFLGALLIGRIAYRWLASRMLALLGGSLFVFYCCRNWSSSSLGEFFILFPTLISLWLLFFVNKPRSPAFYAAGFLWGVAFFIKQVALFDAIGIYIGYLWLAPTSRASKTTATGLMVLGFLSVAALISIYFLSHGALSEAAYSMFVRPLFYARGESVGRGGVFVFLARGIFEQLSLSVLAIAGAVYLVLYQRDHPGVETLKGVPFFRFLLLWLCVDLVGIYAIGRFAAQYLLQLVPLASLLPLFILNQMEARVGKAVWMSLLLPLTAVLLIDFAWDMWYLKSAHWMPAQVRQSVAAAAFIKKNTRPDDRIFLYKPHNFDIFFLSQRLSNNGIYMYDDMILQHMNDYAQAERRKKEFLSNLPAVIVAWPLSANTSVDYIEETLRKEYSLKATLEGGLELYVRNRH